MNRLNYLDSLRGIAICGVVLTHVGQVTIGLPERVYQFSVFGIRGVQLFFIVSALTLCSVYSGRSIDLKSFYIRRFFRIAPMFYLSGAVYLCLFGWGLMTPEFKIDPFDVVLTALFLHGFWPHSINNVVPGGWSIASEAIFYLIFPILLSKITNLKRSAVLLVASFLIATANLVVGRILTNHLSQNRDLFDAFVHFNFLVNLPAFCMGVFVYFLNKEKPFVYKPAFFIVFLSILALFILSSFGYSIPFAQLAAVVLLGFIAWCVSVRSDNIFVNKILSYLGEISFSVYLVHFLVLREARIFVPHFGNSILNLVSLYVVVLLGGAVLASITYRFIEQPMIRYARTLTTNRPVVVIGVS